MTQHKKMRGTAWMTHTDHRRRRPVSSFTSVYVYYVTYRCYASLSLTSTATLTSVLN